MEQNPILTILDGIVIIFVVLSALLAMARGFTREFLGIASIIAAAFFAYFLARPLAPLFRFIDFNPVSGLLNISLETILTIVSGTVVFVIMWILLTIASHWISEFVKDSPVSSIDRSFGFLYGALRGYVLICAIFIMYTLLKVNDGFDLVTRSKTTPFIASGSRILLKLLPEDILRKFQQAPETLKNEALKNTGNGHLNRLPAGALSGQSGLFPLKPSLSGTIDRSNTPQNKPIPSFNLLKIENSVMQSVGEIDPKIKKSSGHAVDSLEDIIERAKQ